MKRKVCLPEGTLLAIHKVVSGDQLVARRRRIIGDLFLLDRRRWWVARYGPALSSPDAAWCRLVTRDVRDGLVILGGLAIRIHRIGRIREETVRSSNLLIALCDLLVEDLVGLGLVGNERLAKNGWWELRTELSESHLGQSILAGWRHAWRNRGAPISWLRCKGRSRSSCTRACTSLNILLDALS